MVRLRLRALLRVLHRRPDGRPGSGADVRVWWPWARRGSLPTAPGAPDRGVSREVRTVPRYHVPVVSLLVQKFGGTSVADPDRIRAVAEHVVRTRRDGNDVVVVVSAMGKTTDDLDPPRPRRLRAPARPRDGHAAHRRRADLDGAAVHGARSTSAVRRCRFTGRQAGIVTDTAHGKAKILEVKGDRIREALAGGKVAVVAGFQGVSHRRATSPRSAAAAPTPPRSRSPPRSTPTCARSTPTSPASTPPTRASCPTRAQARARVVRRDARDGGHRRHGARAALGRVRPQPRRARPRALELHVGAGHLGHRGGRDGHGRRRSSRASRTTPSEAKVTIVQVPDRPGIAATLFRALADDERQRRHDRAERVDRRPHRHLVHRARATTSTARSTIDGEGRRRDRGRAASTHDDDIGRVSLVGAGMKTNPGVAAKMFETLADRGRQHRDDLHVDDPHLVRRARGRRRARGAGAAHGVRARSDARHEESCESA